MNHRLAVVALAVVVSAGAGWAPFTSSGSATGEASPFASRLRYVGRDWATGLPAPVDDRFIAAVEHWVERYGKDREEPIPPPAAEGSGIEAIAIPAIEVAARVGRYGRDEFGRLDVPQDGQTVGWNPGYSPMPGTGGSTFFAAHFEYGGLPGVFARLSQLNAGDEVVVHLTGGRALRYRVTAVSDYALTVADMGALLAGREGVESITLMTCSGPPEDDYPLRTVVFAELVGPEAR